MKILFLGDIVGKTGRIAIQKWFPKLKSHYDPNMIIVNGENSAHGYGINNDIYHFLIDQGVHVITMGNHTWDGKKAAQLMAEKPKIIRPINYPPETPGVGFVIHELITGQKVLVVQVMGQLMMGVNCDCPFAAIKKLLSIYQLGRNVHAIVVDIHAECTSEKSAFGYFCDGQVSLVVGTHTHIPTSDTRILPQGTAYRTDLGMCGDYNSIIGFQKEEILHRFVTKCRKEAMQVADQEASLSGTAVTIDDKTGLALEVSNFQVGGALQTTPSNLADCETNEQ